jgi:hypothetical protein
MISAAVLLVVLAMLSCSTLVLLATDRAVKFPRRALVRFAVPAVIAYAALLVWQPAFLFLSDLAVLVVAVALGSLIGSTLRSPGAVVGFIITAAIIDLFSFSGGLTRLIIDSYRSGESRLLEYLAFSLPIGGRVAPLIGVGDLLILSALFYSLAKLGYPRLVTATVLLVATLAALFVGLAVRGVPGLPFLAGAVLLYAFYRERLRPQPSRSRDAERRAPPD